MSRARHLPSTNRNNPVKFTSRFIPIPPVPTTIFAHMPSKRITPGDRVFPFSGLSIDGPASIASARWRKDGGSYTNVSLGDFTDILSASRFISEVVNLYGTFFYEIELTDGLSNIELVGADVLSKITLGSSKEAVATVKFRPFSDALIAEDPSQILSIEYSVDGDTTVAKTTITRPILYSGTHDGPADNADLVDTGRDFETLGIKIGDIAKNVTDGSQGVITAIVGDTITATLAGGIEDDWDAGETYNILDGGSLDLIARGFELAIATAGFNVVTLFVNDLSSNESSESITVRVT